jgi:hypothetical protein
VKRAIVLMITTVVCASLMAEVSAQTLPSYPTSLHFKASDTTPDYRTKIVFTARLEAAKPKCYQRKPVKLIRNGERLRSKKTNDNGIVKWHVTIRANGMWKTRFLGRTYGTHPNQYICEASLSNKVQIKVQNKF